MAIKASGLRLLGVLCAALLMCGVAAAQQMTVARDSKVHAEPSGTAAVVGELKQGATVEVVGRQGGYVQVKSAEASGWVFAFNVRPAAAGGGASSLAPAPTPQRKGPASATIGIRGLDKEDLKNATFDAKQLDALDGFAK